MLGAGALLGAAIAFKQVAVATAPALVAFAWSLAPAGHRTRGRAARDAAWIALGAGTATVASVLPLVLGGVSPLEYADGAWLILTREGSRVPGAVLERAAAIPPLWWQHPFSLFLPAALVFLALRAPLLRRGVPWGAMVLWLGLEAAGALGSGSYFPHQLKQVVPPLAVVTGLLIGAAAERAAARGLRVTAPALGVAALLFLPYTLVIRPPDGADPRHGRAAHIGVGRWIRARSAPGDLVFTWVGGGLVQAAARRASPSRHFNRNFAASPAALEEIAADLRMHPPRFVVVEWQTPAWLAAYLRECCTRVHERGRDFLAVFERREGR
jgi:hypothetical protein